MSKLRKVSLALLLLAAAPLGGCYYAPYPAYAGAYPSGYPAYSAPAYPVYVAPPLLGGVFIGGGYRGGRGWR